MTGTLFVQMMLRHKSWLSMKISDEYRSFNTALVVVRLRSDALCSMQENIITIKYKILMLSETYLKVLPWPLRPVKM